MNIPPSDHVVWKLLGVLVLGLLYIYGANVYHKNGWSHNDFKGLVGQVGGGFLAMFGPSWLEKAFGRKSDG